MNLTWQDIQDLQIRTLFSLLRTKNRMNREAHKESQKTKVREATQADIDALAR